MFSLLYPFALLLLPLCIVLHRYKSHKQNSYYMPHTQWFKNKPTSKRSMDAFLLWGMLSFAIIAQAYPVHIKRIDTVKNNALDIVLALDTSGSMSLYGFNPKAYKQTRLEVVKEVVSGFIDKRTSDRLGLVVFGTHSSIASPLSFDSNAQKEIVEGLSIGALGKSTALIDALVSSIKLLKNSKSRSKVIILLSDGEDSSSVAPLNIALKLAKKYQVKIYTILIDKTQSNMMELISKSSHTPRFEAKSKADLETVYTQIDSLEKSTLSYKSIAVPQPIYGYFLLLSLLCAFALLWVRRDREMF